MSGKVFPYVKQSAERIPLYIDFTGRLPDDEDIDTASVTVTELVSGTDVTSAILLSSAVATPRVNAVFIAGTTGTRYKVTYLVATTPSSYIFESDAYLDVLDV